MRNTVGKTTTTWDSETEQETTLKKALRKAYAIGMALAALAAIGVPAHGQGLASTGWPKFGGDAGNTGRGIGKGALGVQNWLVNLGYDGNELYSDPQGIRSSPAIGTDGTVYIGAHDGKVHALNPHWVYTRTLTGGWVKKWIVDKWTFQTGGPVHSTPAIGADGTVYVGSDDGDLYALDGQTGQQKWVFQTGGKVDASPAIGADGTIYVGVAGGDVYALKARSWTVRLPNGLYHTNWFVLQKWVYPTNEPYILECPAIGADGTVYVAAGATGTAQGYPQYFGNLYALDGQTGQQKWMDSGNWSTPAIGADGTLYVESIVASGSDAICALDPTTGKTKWINNTNNMDIYTDLLHFEDLGYLNVGVVYPHPPAIGVDGTIYFGCRDGEGSVVAVDGKTGAEKWVFNTQKYTYGLVGADLPYYDYYTSVFSSPAVAADGTVYVRVEGEDARSGTTIGIVLALNGTNGSPQWDFVTGGQTGLGTSPAPAIGADGTVYIVDDYGAVYAIH